MTGHLQADGHDAPFAPFIQAMCTGVAHVPFLEVHPQGASPSRSFNLR